MELAILTYIKNLFGAAKKTDPIPAPDTTSDNDAPKAAHPVNISHRSVSARAALKASAYGIHPRLISKQALSVVEKLNRHGYEAYVVGGCLRDILLGKTPKDFDIATNARPAQIQSIFQQKCRLIGRRFRLAHILFGREIIEVATFRASHTETQNLNQASQSAEGMLLRDNVYGTLEQDAERRDFTVNALYYDPQRNELYDYYQGIDDLKAGKLRLIGSPTVRYQEDPVRMLRAVRFMAKLDMFLDRACAEPIPKLAALLKNIPPARLFDESLKLLQSGHGIKSYQLLREFGLFEQLFPALQPYFTEKGDSFAERMMVTALKSTDERIADNLGINPAFLFAAFFWYPMREKVDILKNEGGLHNHDAYALAANDTLAALSQALVMQRRHVSVIREIWFLQRQLAKRAANNNPARTMTHPRFRAAFDLLVMRAEVEGGEAVEQATWWHEYQLSNAEQRESLVNEQQKTAKPKRKYYRRPRKPKQQG